MIHDSLASIKNVFCQKFTTSERTMTLFELDSRKLFRLSRLDSRAFPAAAQLEQPREHVMSQRCPRPSPSAASASVCGAIDRGFRQLAATFTHNTIVAPESEYSTQLRLHLPIDSKGESKGRAMGCRAAHTLVDCAAQYAGAHPKVGCITQGVHTPPSIGCIYIYAKRSSGTCVV